jgi:hypothetical protein
MSWTVTGRYGKRKRQFSIEGHDFEIAKANALHLIGRFYASNSGTLGNEVWRNGVITLVGEDCVVRKIYDPNEEDE